MSWCKCSSCREEFKSVAGFDMHRVGSFYDNKRRCLKEKEMIKLGMIKKNGVWITAENPFSAWTSRKSAK